MLHVVTKRERKHFPHLCNRESDPKYRAQGRRYIPHGSGDDYEFNPHPQHIEPEYTECGLDWRSRIRYIPSPHNEDYPAAENWPTPWKSVRTYPFVNKRNKIPLAAPGDKSYQVVEYSPDFYKFGSTLPVVDFGRKSCMRRDSLIPLRDLSAHSESYSMKERRRQAEEEMETVRSLEDWRPATPLKPPNHLIAAPQPQQQQNSNDKLEK